MKIEDLYLELGRAMTEKVTTGQNSKAKEKDLQEQISSLQQQTRSLQETTRRKQERIQQHIDELQEAIRLASEGIDPCLAKLTAKEALEERRQFDKQTTAVNWNGTVANNINVTPYYTYPGITVAAGAAAYPTYGYDGTVTVSSKKP